MEAAGEKSVLPAARRVASYHLELESTCGMSPCYATHANYLTLTKRNEHSISNGSEYTRAVVIPMPPFLRRARSGHEHKSNSLAHPPLRGALALLTAPQLLEEDDEPCQRLAHVAVRQLPYQKLALPWKCLRSRAISLGSACYGCPF